MIYTIFAWLIVLGALAVLPKEILKILWALAIVSMAVAAVAVPVLTAFRIINLG